MNVAVTGSRNLNINVAPYMPENITKLISGGARGIDLICESWAHALNIPVETIRPNYNKYYPKVAPLMRNKEIVEKADIVIAFWDGVSHGTKYTIDYAKSLGKPLTIYVFNEKGELINAAN